MLIGQFFITPASPFFVYIAFLLVLAALTVWQRKARHGNQFVPHSHGTITKPRKRNSVRVAQMALAFLAILSAILMLFASLNVQIIKSMAESSNARRILINCDISGSMSVGFEKDSPLPSLEKTRLGQAGKFMREFAEKRRGDSFAIVCFSTDAYVARDFTSDPSQIKEFLAPANLLGVMKNGMFDIPESVRIKEQARHEGTWEINGINLSKEFITSHADYTGEEIIIYLGDLESQAGPISAFVAKELQKLREEDGIKTYAAIIARDYNTKDEEMAAAIARKKLNTFEGTGVPAYEAHNLHDIEKIADRIARDIPESLVQEKVSMRYSLVPWLLLASLISMFAAVILNAKFPRIP